jgi:septum formation protein
LGKPKDHPEATSVLQKLSGSQHEVLTGVVLIDLDRNHRITWCEKTTVYFRQLDSAEIEDYVASGQADDKAGSYGIQGQAAAFVNRIEGCYFNVVGLPLASLVRQMRQLAHPAESKV